MSVPILLLTFNRPDTTQKVFDIIKKIKPKQLFIAQDGPRSEEEKIKTDAVKKIWEIDRDCEAKYLTRKENLGCLKAVSEGIDRFFSEVEFGIILEDDCIPSEYISDFCEKIDNIYKNDPKIGTISLSNFQKSSRNNKGDIYFTDHNPLLRGRATWKDRREKYKTFPEVINNLSKDHIDGNRLQKKSVNRYMNGGYRDSNRYAVSYANHRLTIVAPVNLITNIGYIGIHNQRPGKYHDLEIRKYSDILILDKIYIDNFYNKEMLGFISKMYIYTNIEIFLKKIGLFSLFHKSFIYCINIFKGK